MIVVDVGCHPHGNEESVNKLIERFRPSILFGFDPYPLLEEGVIYTAGTTIVRRRVAAWTHANHLPYRVEGHEGVPGIASGIVAPNDATHIVDGIDLPAFLSALPADDGLVLKLDCEGAEYPLLAALHRLDVDERLSLVLVEWHPEELAHQFYLVPEDRPVLRCPVEEWA